jgi:hypothetical protein
MSIPASLRFLRNVLFADAASCLATGASQVLAPAWLAQLLNIPAPLLAGTGAFLLAYGAIVGIVAMRDPLPRAPVWLFMAGNVGWAVACALLLVEGWFTPSAWGEAWILAQAVTVAALAVLQWAGLRRGVRVPAWA